MTLIYQYNYYKQLGENMKFTNKSDSQLLAVHGIFSDPTRLLLLEPQESKSFPITRLSLSWQALSFSLPNLEVNTAEGNDDLDDKAFLKATTSVNTSLDKPGTLFVRIPYSREPTEEEKKVLSFLFPDSEAVEKEKHEEYPEIVEPDEKEDKKLGKKAKSPKVPEEKVVEEVPQELATITLSKNLANTETVNQGEPLTLSVAAKSSDNKSTLSYKWLKDDSEIPGANSDTYTKELADSSDSGVYKVEVSGSKKETKVISESCTVTVN